MNDLDVKPRDVMDCTQWRAMIRVKWSGINNDSDAENWIWTVHFCCQLSQVDLDKDEFLCLLFLSSL